MMAKALIYPSKFDQENKEVCDIASGQTLSNWLFCNVDGYYESDEPLFSALLNGEFFPVNQWAVYEILSGDEFELTVEAKGVEVAVLVIVAVVSAAVAIHAMNQIPDNYNTTTPAGSSIYDVNAQGNRARLMGIIPEQAGTHKSFPDYLCQPRAFYLNDEQWKYIFVSLGVGEREIASEGILIGNTPVNRYAGDIEYEVFPPGADVSGNDATRNFYTSGEVGSATGSSGLEVKAPINKFVAVRNSNRAISVHTDDNSIRFYSNTYAAADYFPWKVGDQFQLSDFSENIELYEGVVDLVDMTAANADRIQAPFGLGGIAVGAKIQLVGAGSNDGSYLVGAVDVVDGTYIELNDLNGDPVTWLVPATSVMIRLLGSHNLLGLYRVDSVYKYSSSSHGGNNAATVSRVGDPSWSGFSQDAYYHDISAELVNGEIEPSSVGPFLASPVSEVSNYIELDFFFDGLGRLNDSGSVSSHSVEIEIRYRRVGTVVWSKVRHTFTAASLDQVGRTVPINLPSKMSVEVEVVRITAEENNLRLHEAVQWIALRSELDTVASYPDVTTMAIKIRGTSALSSSSENKLNVISTRKLPIYSNGSWSAPVATDDIDAFAAYVIKDSGYSDSTIALDEFDRLGQVWRERGDTFSAMFDTDSQLFPVLKRVLSVGYAEPTLDYGQIVPVRDEKRTVFEHMYQPDNGVGLGLERNTSLISSDEKDGVEVEYIDPDTWKSETVQCLLPGDLGINLEKVRAFGITDRTRAWRYGMRKRRIRRYRRTQYSFKTEMDALNSRYMSYCALADDMPGYSQNGVVLDVVGRHILTDADIEWGDGAHYISLRRPDGTLSGPYPCIATESPGAVLISGDLDFSPVFDGRIDPPLFMFGEASRWCYPALVTDIDPRGTEEVSVKASNYDERAYADDDNFPPA